MKVLSITDANTYLATLGMQLGGWHQIAGVGSAKSAATTWQSYRPPERGLLNFCHHVIGWLPKGAWKILQIDDSTGWIDPIQGSLLAGLMFGSSDLPDINRFSSRTFLFEFGSGTESDENNDLLVANLIYVLFLFQSHAYVVSAGSTAGEMIGIQDGCAYFGSVKGDASVVALRKRFERDPLGPPQWISEIQARRQAGLTASDVSS